MGLNLTCVYEGWYYIHAHQLGNIHFVTSDPNPPHIQIYHKILFHKLFDISHKYQFLHNIIIDKLQQ